MRNIDWNVGYDESSLEDYMQGRKEEKVILVLFFTRYGRIKWVATASLTYKYWSEKIIFVHFYMLSILISFFRNFGGCSFAFHSGHYFIFRYSLLIVYDGIWFMSFTIFNWVLYILRLMYSSQCRFLTSTLSVFNQLSVLLYAWIGDISIQRLDIERLLFTGKVITQFSLLLP